MRKEKRYLLYFCKSCQQKTINVFLAVSLLVGLTSCDRNKTDSSAIKSPVLEKAIERGPFTIRIEASQGEITTADQLTLRLEVLAAADYEVEFPKLTDKLEEFKIVDHDEPQPTLANDGKMLHTQIYTLEPFLAGDYKIPPMKISFKKKNDPKAEKHDVQTEPLTIRVYSILPPNSCEAKLKDLFPPMDIPGLNRKMILIVASLLAILAMAMTGVIFYRRNRNGLSDTKMFRLPPHEIAHRELDHLINDRLIEKGEIKLFYYRISAILRHYIENRFSLRAPEQTTEEFLFDLRQSPMLTNSQKQILKDFLNHCDLVKFARFQPDSDENSKTVQICREFIDETKQEDIVEVTK
jgi:hypothetical protein